MFIDKRVHYPNASQSKTTNVYETFRSQFRSQNSCYLRTIIKYVRNMLVASELSEICQSVLLSVLDENFCCHIEIFGPN